MVTVGGDREEAESRTQSLGRRAEEQNGGLMGDLTQTSPTSAPELQDRETL